MRHLRTSLIVLGVMSLLLGIVYPLVMTGVAQLVFRNRANGSLIRTPTPNTQHPVPGPIGSELIGQSFTSPAYFHGRPSECGYDASHSSGSNLGPLNPDLSARTDSLVRRTRRLNGLPDSASIPADLVLASGSGLDPDISPRAAYLQVGRVAVARNLDSVALRTLVDSKVRYPALGVFGMPRVNVLILNLALDSMSQENIRGDSPLRGVSPAKSK
jgi:potassium-transporting ATPase KdpC subunit